ncbi:MAG: hypothetical protein R3E09_05335 [Novosphingobium sp.]|nr:hypothetical protein [Novosphingobium sp.]
MSESKAFASLSPSLLARKGAAKPAMRPQLHPIQQFTEATARQLEDDLGWNDHGEDIEFPAEQASDSIPQEEFTAQVVSLNGVDLTGMDVPEVVRQQEAITRRINKTPQRRSAQSQGRRIAFTLRLDDERHLKLRLAATVCNRSAQQIVTEALDRLLDEIPELEALVSRIGDRS